MDLIDILPSSWLYVWSYTHWWWKRFLLRPNTLQLSLLLLLYYYYYKCCSSKQHICSSKKQQQHAYIILPHHHHNPQNMMSKLRRHTLQQQQQQGEKQIVVVSNHDQTKTHTIFLERHNIGNSKAWLGVHASVGHFEKTGLWNIASGVDTKWKNVDNQRREELTRRLSNKCKTPHNVVNLDNCRTQLIRWFVPKKERVIPMAVLVISLDIPAKARGMTSFSISVWPPPPEQQCGSAKLHQISLVQSSFQSLFCPHYFLNMLQVHCLIQTAKNPPIQWQDAIMHAVFVFCIVFSAKSFAMKWDSCTSSSREWRVRRECGRFLLLLLVCERRRKILIICIFKTTTKMHRQFAQQQQRHHVRRRRRRSFFCPHPIQFMPNFCRGSELCWPNDWF